MTQSRRPSSSGGVSSPGETTKPFDFEPSSTLTLFFVILYVGVAIGCTPREYLPDIFNTILDFVLVFRVTLREIAKLSAAYLLGGHVVESSVAYKVASEKDPENAVRWATFSGFYGYLSLIRLLEMKPRKKAY